MVKKNILKLAFLINFTSSICCAQYTKLFDFYDINGNNPQGSLISDGTYLYGMTKQGGATTNEGVLFKIKLDGTGFVQLMDFCSPLCSYNGKYPNGDLFSDGIFLYGMTSDGGANNGGTIFKIKKDGSSYTKLLDFTPSGLNNGFIPMGSLISDGVYLYGMTRKGGANNLGTIFKIKPDGTNYSKIFEFSGISNGSNPEGNLFFDGTFLYGMTYDGGINSKGVIFKIKTDGSNYNTLYNFSGPDGLNPFGSLISDGTFLYGMTNLGGNSPSVGTIFKIKFDGSNFTKIFDFTFPSSTYGGGPRGSLVFDGTFLYGMTSGGGTNGDGVIFKIKSDGTNFSKLHEFQLLTSGKYPYGSLILEGNNLYGMTSKGSDFHFGTIFKYGLNQVGINEEQFIQNYSVFPNPSSNYINIFINSFKSKNITVKLFDLLGNEIKKENKYLVVGENEFELNLSELNSGLYLLKVDNQIQKIQIIK